MDIIKIVESLEENIEYGLLMKGVSEKKMKQKIQEGDFLACY